ncbi:MAG: hypothetical protein NC393_00530 [Clostridium sp.]|nr:hypothetical protein [Clostridium sp.]MCM1207299.1 hypothetical protein [Ruminococcus sp.]
MDELIKALGEVENVLRDYIDSMAQNMQEIAMMVNDTQSNLGNDTLAIKTTEKLKSVSTQISGSIDEAYGLLKKVTNKRNDLIEIRKSY